MNMDETSQLNNRNMRATNKDTLVILVLLLLVLVGLTVANWRFTSSSPGGNDFVPRWLGTRLLLTEGLNPYGSETSRLIQEFVYGREANPNEDQQLFAYPLHAVFVFAPFALIENYNLVRAIWMTVLEISLVIMAFIGLRLSNIRLSPWILGGAAIFGLLWYHGMRPLINGNPSILSALFLAVSLVAIRAKQDLLAGVLLALATLKPQIVILIIPLTLVWSLSHRRWKLLSSFFLSLLIMLIATLVIEPGWIPQNLNQIRYYPEYTLPGTPRSLLEVWWPGWGLIIALAITVITGTILLWMWANAWRAPFTVYLWAAFGTMAITNLIGIQTAVSNYVAMLPAVIFVLAALSIKVVRRGKWISLSLASAILIGLWVLFLTTQEGRSQSGLMFFPIPVFLLVTLILLRPKTKGLIKIIRP